ncbi:MAG: N-acetylmannosamine-6-phosphate 2-epimerase [Cyanobacteria bacterium]|nr:N-acetylmannosamine-6-phosphate 2-epimerase [Cyanobacteria bacterium CG_2015-16_32_12]NCO77710.1 N-acetylmannosamine-6-phosphate 2-epimerase [Cyanobacteria bacterium CG_2015-22_32_23]NCQ03014.1 N-acetylmannosamine-6-phosphate 2-epimerase [Cyanobacteria bacterium CG_2015-09_32_10]NCQ40716.1 N-acetylmannosamine-6-phosphate 2-epimerase [Cyanobacteria bacterium CG_2015-04_32_10]NCS85332.1 N-acetylmannosamine-6-phosphate 2-epimerase [Cyanobacteria bacterium CG_2015-02_32_10]
MIETLQSSLIISCQAPSDSPLHNPDIISAIAKACVNQGAKGLRIDSPSHIRAVKQLLPDIPVIGLWKQMGLNSSVYITPRFMDALAVSEAGADIIAIDATQRSRPHGETFAEIITQIKEKLGKLVMADIDTLENAIAASNAGADFIGTTLYGYTEITQDLIPPSFEFIEKLVKTIDKPIICEGGIKTPEEVRKALDLGCFSVVVGTAITGIDLLAQKFVKIT